MNCLNKIKHCFSMVEIILAIAVMGAGLTLILVLFPVALTSARDVTDNTYVPSIGSHFITLVRARVAADVDNSGNHYLFTDSNSFVEKLQDITSRDFTNYMADDLVISADYDTLDGTIATEYEDSKGDNFIWTAQEEQGTNGLSDIESPDMESVSFYTHDSQFGRYLVLFKSPSQDNELEDLRYSNIDFAAEVNIVKEEVDEIYPYESGDISNIDDYATKIYVHISWPIEVPMSARKSKVYSLDLYNSALGGM